MSSTRACKCGCSAQATGVSRRCYASWAGTFTATRVPLPEGASSAPPATPPARWALAARFLGIDGLADLGQKRGWLVLTFPNADPCTVGIEGLANPRQDAGKGIYGYRYVLETKKRVIYEPEAQLLRRIFEACLRGESCYSIAVRLNEGGIPAFGGGLWHPRTVKRMLFNPSYKGTRYRGDQAQAGRIVIRRGRAG